MFPTSKSALSNNTTNLRVSPLRPHNSLAFSTVFASSSLSFDSTSKFTLKTLRFTFSHSSSCVRRDPVIRANKSNYHAALNVDRNSSLQETKTAPRKIAHKHHSRRQVQRYVKGRRQVVGCIPYRYREAKQSSSVDGDITEQIEVLLITCSRKKSGMLFPKGGWEINGSMEDAALRETLEEAGVVGSLERKLGKWIYKSRTGYLVHEGYMFPLLVKKQLESWPEKNRRRRQWMTIAQAREVCLYQWMREALDVLVSRHTQQ